MIGPIRLATLLFALGCTASDTAETEEKTCKNECPATKTELKKNSEKSVMRSQGLGESPGIPNLEYLGLGYNIFEGNPRGSEISESDPGFRGRVVELIQDQKNLTIDQDYMVPFGVDLKYVTACNFDSKATELSSASQYQSELSKEASQKEEINAAGSKGLVSVSAKHAFSKSSKFKEFSDNTKATQSVSFEARALCSEFKASLEPYYEHKFRKTFDTALKGLSHPWTNSDEQREQYSKFFDAYGTHYIHDLTLGAKHVFTSEMKSEDVSELSREEVDIASTLSFSVQASVGIVGGGGAGGSNDEYGQLLREENDVGGKKTYTYVFEKPHDVGDSLEDMLKGPGAGVSGGYSLDSTSHSNTQTSSVNKVRSKVSAVHELNIGGNPPVDGNWKTWASTVRDRPMPIAYKFTGIWNLIDDESVLKAFEGAIKDLYNIDMREEKDSSIIDALRFGVAHGDGKAISSYSREAKSDYRSKLRLTSIPGGFVEKEVTGNIVKSSDEDLDVYDECKSYGQWSEYLEPDNAPERFACGMKAEKSIGRDIGIVDLSIVYCSLEDWKNQETKSFETYKGKNSNTVMCNDHEFIIGVRVKVDATSGENEGINSIWIQCAKVAQTKDEKVKESEKRVYYDSEGAQTWQKKRSNANTFLKRAKVRHCSGLGIFGLDLEFSEPEKGGRKYATYEYDVSREDDSVAAIFASTIRGNVGENRDEDQKELGFIAPSQAFGKNVFNVLSYYPFGLMEKNKAKIVVQDFKDQVIRSNELQSFSFLSAKNLPKEANYVAGIVHPDGYAVNDNFMDGNVGFQVVKESKQEFHITFSGENSLTNPTFIAFPLWFPRFENKFPSSIGDIVIGTRSCDEKKCVVWTGTDKPKFGKGFLGFSFVALQGDLNPDLVSGIVHGKVSIKVNGKGKPTIDDNSSQFNGFDAENKFSEQSIAFKKIGYQAYNNKEVTFNEHTGGILIKFDKAFRGIPSVIVNPIIEDRVMKVKSIDLVDLPYAVVEHITETSAFIKVNWVSTVTEKVTDQPTTPPLSFHIVAVGPQQDPFKDDSSNTGIQDAVTSEE